MLQSLVMPKAMTRARTRLYRSYTRPIIRRVACDSHGVRLRCSALMMLLPFLFCVNQRTLRAAFPILSESLWRDGHATCRMLES